MAGAYSKIFPKSKEDVEIKSNSIITPTDSVKLVSYTPQQSPYINPMLNKKDDLTPNQKLRRDHPTLAKLYDLLEVITEKADKGTKEERSELYKQQSKLRIDIYQYKAEFGISREVMLRYM